MPPPKLRQSLTRPKQPLMRRFFTNITHIQNGGFLVDESSNFVKIAHFLMLDGKLKIITNFDSCMTNSKRLHIHVGLKVSVNLIFILQLVCMEMEYRLIR